jgi:UDP-N-acetylglucosamine--N-acetylmuramyl-(pentapeptide) pyrophosphoryl-undecaprenol N-acetylglucosamine transferase
VRQDLIDIDSKRAAAIEYFNLDAAKKTLVLGGSLGARRVNQLIEKELNIQDQDVQVMAMRKFILSIKNTICCSGLFYRKNGFCVCSCRYYYFRAGASSVSELCIVESRYFHSFPCS